MKGRSAHAKARRAECPQAGATEEKDMQRTFIGRRVSRGFTLVEILIVVIILGILAAIVIPQFTNASQDARKNSVTSQLQTIRSQIELYKLQHKDQIPALITNAGGMWTPFTQYTDINGVVSA